MTREPTRCHCGGFGGVQDPSGFHCQGIWYISVYLTLLMCPQPSCDTVFFCEFTSAAISGMPDGSDKQPLWYFSLASDPQADLTATIRFKQKPLSIRAPPNSRSLMADTPSHPTGSSAEAKACTIIFRIIATPNRNCILLANHEVFCLPFPNHPTALLMSLLRGLQKGRPENGSADRISRTRIGNPLT